MAQRLLSYFSHNKYRLMMFLLLARVVTTRTLRKVRKYTFLGLVVFCAVITPSQDPITLFAMALRQPSISGSSGSPV